MKIKIKKEQTSIIDWSNVKISATWSQNVYSPSSVSGRWVGMEISVESDLSEEEDRERTIQEISGRLTELCRDAVSKNVAAYIEQDEGDWRT